MNLAHIEPLLLSTIQVLRKMEMEDGPHLQRVEEVLCTSLQPYGIKVSEVEKKNFKQNVKVKFLSSLVSHLESRFPNSEVLTALAVLDPANTPADFVFYGEEEVALLATHFDVESNDLLSEWTHFRELMNSTFKESTFEQSLKTVHSQPALTEMFPMVTKILSVAGTLPVLAAECERGFSEMKKTKTDLQNRLKATTLDCLMRISLEGPSRNDFDFVKAATVWLRNKNRRLVSYKQKNTLPRLD